MNEITNSIIEFFQNTLNNDILTIIIIALFPIIELRGAIPVAFKLGMPWYESLFFAWLGSSLVVPLLLLLLRPILNAMKRCKLFKSLAHAVESNFQGKADKILSKADSEASHKKALIKKLIGVFAFVAVPLPLTGVWTGSAVAAFLGLSFWQALPVILLGNLTAGIIMTVLSVCFKAYVDTILSVFLIIVLVVLAFYIVMLVVRMVKNKKKAQENSNMNMIETADNSITDVENNDNDVEESDKVKEADTEEETPIEQDEKPEE